MPVKINGATSGSVTLAAPATGSDVTVNLPAAAGTLATLNSPAFTGTPTVNGISIDAVSGATLITKVALSGSGININGCFTTTYDNYMIVGNAQKSTAAGVRWRLLSNGTPDTSTSYEYQYMLASSSTLVGGSGTLTGVDVLDTISSLEEYHLAYISYPATARNTLFIIHNGTSRRLINWRYDHIVAAAYDGLQIYPSTGTFTGGSISIYGLKK